MNEYINLDAVNFYYCFNSKSNKYDVISTIIDISGYKMKMVPPFMQTTFSVNLANFFISLTLPNSGFTQSTKAAVGNTLVHLRR